MDKIAMVIQGGRDEGFRGFTRKTNLTAGEWKIDVSTEAGQVLGTLHFQVENIENPDFELGTERF